MITNCWIAFLGQARQAMNFVSAHPLARRSSAVQYFWNALSHWISKWSIRDDKHSTPAEGPRLTDRVRMGLPRRTRVKRPNVDAEQRNIFFLTDCSAFRTRAHVTFRKQLHLVQSRLERLVYGLTTNQHDLVIQANEDLCVALGRLRDESMPDCSIFEFIKGRLSRRLSACDRHVLPIMLRGARRLRRHSAQFPSTRLEALDPAVAIYLDAYYGGVVWVQKSCAIAGRRTFEHLVSSHIQYAVQRQWLEKVVNALVAEEHHQRVLEHSTGQLYDKDDISQHVVEHTLTHSRIRRLRLERVRAMSAFDSLDD